MYLSTIFIAFAVIIAGHATALPFRPTLNSADDLSAPDLKDTSFLRARAGYYPDDFALAQKLNEEDRKSTTQGSNSVHKPTGPGTGRDEKVANRASGKKGTSSKDDDALEFLKFAPSPFQ